MTTTTTQTRTEPTSSQGPTPEPPPRRDAPRSLWGTAQQVLKPIASLKLTVILFALAMFLTYVGTAAQMRYGVWTVVENHFRSIIAKVEIASIFLYAWDIPGYILFPGGWLIGGLMLVNLIAAHVSRFKISWKRTGIILTHAGLIIMLLSELVTGLFAQEGNMTILEGQASNYVEDIRSAELAVIDSSDPKLDHVTVVPQPILEDEGAAQHPDLPFDVEVVDFMANSALFQASSVKDQSNPATAGIGQEAIALERPVITGTDSDQQVDMPSLYVTLKDKNTGEPIGTYLFSTRLADAQQVTVGDTTYDLRLRFARTYKPYTLHLIDFKHETYLGTTIPKDFSSYVRLVDPEMNVDRDVRIYMNNPLRYRGDTFFQASFLQGDTGTVLQVVRNPGWLMPYISCVIVGVGLILHFGMSLIKFSNRRAAA